MRIIVVSLLLFFCIPHFKFCPFHSHPPPCRVDWVSASIRIGTLPLFIPFFGGSQLPCLLTHSLPFQWRWASFLVTHTPFFVVPFDPPFVVTRTFFLESRRLLCLYLLCCFVVSRNLLFSSSHVRFFLLVTPKRLSPPNTLTLLFWFFRPEESVELFKNKKMQEIFGCESASPLALLSCQLVSRLDRQIPSFLRRGFVKCDSQVGLIDFFSFITEFCASDYPCVFLFRVRFILWNYVSYFTSIDQFYFAPCPSLRKWE